jgi:hypothetical protein
MFKNRNKYFKCFKELIKNPMSQVNLKKALNQQLEYLTIKDNEVQLFMYIIHIEILQVRVIDQLDYLIILRMNRIVVKEHKEKPIENTKQEQDLFKQLKCFKTKINNQKEKRM